MNMLTKLCIQCTQRADAFGWKGKTGDKLAFEWMIGAAVGLKEANHPEAEHVINCVAMIIAVRGLFEVRRIASVEKHPIAHAIPARVF